MNKTYESNTPIDQTLDAKESGNPLNSPMKQIIGVKEKASKENFLLLIQEILLSGSISKDTSLVKKQDATVDTWVGNIQREPDETHRFKHHASVKALLSGLRELLENEPQILKIGMKPIRQGMELWATCENDDDYSIFNKLSQVTLNFELNTSIEVYTIVVYENECPYSSEEFLLEMTPHAKR